MTKSRIDAIALFAAMIAAAVALAQLPESLAWLSSIAAVVLLLMILAYDQDGYRSMFQSLAFSAVCGFCAVVAGATGFRAWVLRAQLLGPDVQLAIDPVAGNWLLVTWACLTVLIWVIDRIRMNSRQAVYEDAAQLVKRSGSMFAIATDASANRPSENAPKAVPPSLPEPVPVSVPITPSPTAAASAPVAQPAPQGAVPVRPLKESMVYVNLMGEGLNVMRSVRAEHLGRNFYKIVEAMPQGETWEYGPGQVVRCEKKKLSTGKALVAVEEAPRRP